MKNKVLPLAIIVLMILSFVGGMFTEKGLNHRAIIKELKEKNGGVLPTEEESNKKYTLTGLYLTEEREVMEVDGFIKQTRRTAITVYSNGLISIQPITINELKDIGKEIIKGGETTFKYSMSIEAGTILLQEQTTNKTQPSTYTYRFSDDFEKIIDSANNEYKSYKGGIDDIYVSDNIRDEMKERNIDFEGVYSYSGDGTIKWSYTFNKNGIVHYQTESTTNGISGGKCYYYVKDNDIYIYVIGMGLVRGTLSNDKKMLEISNNYLYDMKPYYYTLQ